jgi:hypothetical protein
VKRLALKIIKITYDKKGKIEKSETPAIRLEKIYPESFMDIIATEVCKL